MHRLRHRLPRRHARGLHGRARPRRRRRRRRRGQGREAVRRRGAVLRARPGGRGTLAQPRRGRLRFTTSYDEAAAFADVHFLGVGTPQKRGEFAADLTHVDAVIDALAPLLTRPSVIVGKSTVPVGTAADLAVRAPGVELAWNPEFLREGFAVAGHPAPGPARARRAVRRRAEARAARGLRAAARRRARRSWSPTCRPPSWSRSSANAFLATKISFINAMAEVCEATGADVDAARRRARLRRPDRAAVPQRRPRLRRRLPAQGHPRVHGPRRRARRRPGADVPARGRQHQHAPPRPGWSTWPREACGGSLLGANVAVLGAAFKPDSDDVRDSPALNVAGQLQLQGAAVTVYDPQGAGQRPATVPDAELRDLRASRRASGADVVLVLTEWPEFVELDPDRARPRWSRTRRSSTAATAWTRRSGARAAGAIGRWGAPESFRCPSRVDSADSEWITI